MLSVEIVVGMLMFLCIQLKTRAVSAKTMTMVAPLHLLLFASSSIVSHGEGVVKMDQW